MTETDEHRAGHRGEAVGSIPRTPTEARGEPSPGAPALARGEASGLAHGAPGTTVDARRDRRKFLLPNAQVETVLDACRRGVPETQIARALGINYRTWMRVRDEDERVACALAEVKKIEEEELVSLLLDKARAGDTTSIIFALKGRHGYRDQGPPPGSDRPRVNVTINLPAAQPTVDDYVRAIDVEAAPAATIDDDEDFLR